MIDKLIIAIFVTGLSIACCRPDVCELDQGECGSDVVEDESYLQLHYKQLHIFPDEEINTATYMDTEADEDDSGADLSEGSGGSNYQPTTKNDASGRDAENCDLDILHREALLEIENESNRVSSILLDIYGSSNDFDGQKMAAMWRNTFPFTANQSWKVFAEDCTTYVTTGDIHEMWLRDSAVQMLTYLPLIANQDPDSALRKVFESVLTRQMHFISSDPYASAFHLERGPNLDECPPSRQCPMCKCSDCKPACGDYTYQHDFELDSLCFPLFLHYKYWKATGVTSHLSDEFLHVVENQILPLFKSEQFHNSKSSYFYKKDKHPVKDGVGLVWSYARPSDDQTSYGYNIPQNMFVVVVLNQLAEMARTVGNNNGLFAEASLLARQIDSAIHQHGIIDDAVSGNKIYAFEVDGFGNFTREDDANMPNLLWMPQLGYTPVFRKTLWRRSRLPSRFEEPLVPRYLESTGDLYAATRAFVLSSANPNYFSGVYSGLGSHHQSHGLRPVHRGTECRRKCIWPLGIIMQGWTATDQSERNSAMNVLLKTDNNHNMLHEGFDANDPRKYNRDLFGWANGLFALWVMDVWLPKHAVPTSSTSDDSVVGTDKFQIMYVLGLLILAVVVVCICRVFQNSQSRFLFTSYVGVDHEKIKRHKEIFQELRQHGN